MLLLFFSYTNSAKLREDVKSFLFQYYRSVEAMPSILEGRSGNQEYMVYAKDLRIS